MQTFCTETISPPHFDEVYGQSHTPSPLKERLVLVVTLGSVVHHIFVCNAMNCPFESREEWTFSSIFIKSGPGRRVSGPFL